MQLFLFLIAAEKSHSQKGYHMSDLNLSRFKECAIPDVLEKVGTKKRLILFEGMGLTDKEVCKASYDLMRMEEDAKSRLFAGFATEMPKGTRYDEIPLTNAYSVRFGCTIQICLTDGHSILGDGSPGIYYGKYTEGKAIFIGEPERALTGGDGEYYAVYYPNGIRAWTGFRDDGSSCLTGGTVSESAFMCVRRDRVRPDGKILRDSPRGWQGPDGTMYHWGNPLWEALQRQ